MPQLENKTAFGRGSRLGILVNPGPNLDLDHDPDFEYPANYGHDPFTR